MDISSAILNIYKIESIFVEDFKEMLINKNTKRYRIKLDTRKNGLLIQDMKNPKNLIMVKCIKEYFSQTREKQIFTEETGCSQVQETILNERICSSCEECHRTCLSKLDSRQIHRIKYRSE